MELGRADAEKAPGLYSPLLMVEQHGKLRVCEDARTLNAWCVREDTSIMPTVHDCLQSVQGNTWLGLLDIKSAFLQLPLDEASRRYFRFVVNVDGASRIFQWRVMPFGWVNAPVVWQSYITEVLHEPVEREWVRIYVDDILVVGKGEDELMERMDTVLRLLQQAGLQVKLAKCAVGVSKLQYLGMEVDADTCAIPGARLQALRNMAPPRSLPELRALIGLLNYFNSFVGLQGTPEWEKLLHLAANAKRIPGSWASKWRGEPEEAHRRVVDRVLQAAPLHFIVPGRTLVVRTDASGTGLGYALYQLTEKAQGLWDANAKVELQDESMELVHLGGRQLTTAERTLSATEREALGIKVAVDKLTPVLQGRRFILVTDHRNLPWMRDSINPMARRWAMRPSICIVIVS